MITEAGIHGWRYGYLIFESGVTDVPDAHCQTIEAGMSFHMDGSGFGVLVCLLRIARRVRSG